MSRPSTPETYSPPLFRPAAVPRGLGGLSPSQSVSACLAQPPGPSCFASTSSAAYITTSPPSTPPPCSPTAHSRLADGDVRNGVRIVQDDGGSSMEGEWLPYLGDRYVRADIPQTQVEAALEAGDYVIIEEEILEEVSVEEPGQKPNVVRRIRRKVLKSRSRSDIHNVSENWETDSAASYSSRRMDCGGASILPRPQVSGAPLECVSHMVSGNDDDAASEASVSSSVSRPPQPIVSKPPVSSMEADDEVVPDEEEFEAKSEGMELDSIYSAGDDAEDGFVCWERPQLPEEPPPPSVKTARRFHDPYQLDRHAVWYGDKYKWMTGVPLPAWVMELRLSDESAFTECMEHFQAYGRWPSDAELGPCPTAIPAAGGGFMHNPAAPLPTFVKLTRDRQTLNQYFTHFKIFGRWPRIA